MRRLLFAFMVLFLFCAGDAFGYVTVLRAKTCGDAVAELERSVQGHRQRLSHDPTMAPPVILSEAEYREEAFSSVAVVHGVYKQIFEQLLQSGRMSEGEPEKILNAIVEEDRRRLTDKSHGLNGFDNTVYFISKKADGRPVSILRATFIRKGETRKLPLEEKGVTVEGGNRVELERAFNMVGPVAEIAAHETMMVVAKFINSYFGSDDYTLYGQTDAARARLYHKDYGFDSKTLPDQPAVLRYLVSVPGSDFQYRYVGHIDQAFRLAFNSPYRASDGLSLLEEMERRPGMKDYIPNLVAQSIIHASQRHYDLALEISEHLKQIGYAEVNMDFNTLWRSRIAYDGIFGNGDPQKALALVDDYLARQPLDLNDYNERALLFVNYKMKIFLSQERYDDAAALLKSAKTVVASGWIRQQSLFDQQWSWIQRIPMYLRTASPLQVARSRLYAITLSWDLGTHVEPTAISALHPETYRLAAADATRLGDHTLALRFSRNADWLEKNLKNQ